MIDKIEYYEQINKLKTPCYIIDLNVLDANARNLMSDFSEGWSHDVLFGYSVKTNSLPWLITHMKKKGFLAEVVSRQEYKLVKRLGIKDDDIIFNGPIKDDDCLIEALNGGSRVNLDNFNEIELIKKRIGDKHSKWEIGLRYNFLLEDYCLGETIMGKEQGRFGFNVENGDFGRAVHELKALGINISGLHGHNSTKTKSLTVFSIIARMASRLIEKYDLNPEYVDVGGGFYGDKPGTPTYKEYIDAIAKELRVYKNLTLIVEPGASLTSSPISYLTTVKNIRDCNDTRFVTTDGSLIHINPQFHNYQLACSVIKRSESKTKMIKKQVICGFTCIEKDRMRLLENEEEIDTDDKVEFYNCGSYSMTLAPLFINYFPEVYVKDGDEYRCVRKSWDEEDFINKCEVDT